jgi:hypothetical protein
MSQLQETITLGPEDEAQRLWQGAQEARARAGESVAALSETLDLGLRAVEILIVHALRPIKGDLPATIGLLLEEPNAEVDTYRDAVTIPRTLGFSDALDLLSDESLDCVGPSLHRGWEDRVFACRRSRKTAQEAIGVSLGADERDRLLLLSAYRNRIFRTPPPVQIQSQPILEALGDLETLMASLLAKL